MAQKPKESNKGKLYRKIFNAQLQSDSEAVISLSFFYEKRPVILALIYSKCPGICNPLVFRLREIVQSVSDRNYYLIVVSFDPHDSLNNVLDLKKRAGFDQKNCYFAVTNDIQQLKKSIGFSPVYDSIRRQYDHDALLTGINREGYITESSNGLTEIKEFQRIVKSLNGQYSPSYRLPGNDKIFSCFNYNPLTGKNSPGTGLFFIALPPVITIFLLLLINYLVRSSRK